MITFLNQSSPSLNQWEKQGQKHKTTNLYSEINKTLLTLGENCILSVPIKAFSWAILCVGIGMCPANELLCGTLCWSLHLLGHRADIFFICLSFCQMELFKMQSFPHPGWCVWKVLLPWRSGAARGASCVKFLMLDISWIQELVPGGCEHPQDPRWN